MAFAHTAEKAADNFALAGLSVGDPLSSSADWTARFSETATLRWAKSSLASHIFRQSGSGNAVYEFVTYDPASADYSVEAGFGDKNSDSGNFLFGPAARCVQNGASFDGYVTAFYYIKGGTSVIRLYRVIAGAFTILVEDNNGGAGHSFADGDSLRLEVSGTGASVTLKVYKNTSEIISTTDSHANRLVATGRGGLYGWCNNISYPRLDDWWLYETAGIGDIFGRAGGPVGSSIIRPGRT